MSAISRRSSIALLLTVSLVVGALLVGGVTGQMGTQQTGDASPDQNSTFVRVAHVSPDAPPVDVVVDGEEVLTDVEFGDVSEYMTFSSGEHSVTITTAGEEETTLFEGEVTFEARTATTVFAAGEVEEDAEEPFDLVAFEDDALEPAENESVVNVVHLSPDAPTVDVTADNGSLLLADDLSYRNASSYTTVAAGNLTVEVRPATEENDGDVVESENISLEGGSVHSVLAIGFVNGFDSTVNEGFRVQVIEDASKTIQLPSEEEVEAETPTETETATETEIETATETATETEIETETATETATETETETEIETPTETGTETETATETATETTEPADVTATATEEG